MSSISIKKIFSVAKSEYSKWICNGRMFLVVILWVFIKECVIDPIIERCDIMNQPLNVLEPFLATGNSGIMILILPLVYLTLISDFPRVDGNTVLFLPRVGRYNWYLGQLLFAIFSFHTFLLLVFVGSVLPILNRSFFYNGWSLVVTDYEILYPESAGSFASELFPKNLYNQMPPVKAAILTYVLLTAYMMVLAMIMMVFRIWKKKIFGFVVCGALITLGCAFGAIKSAMQWLFPMAHSVTWIHYSDYYRKLEMPLENSFLYFTVWIVVLFLAGLVSVKKMNFDSIQEVD